MPICIKRVDEFDYLILDIPTNINKVMKFIGSSIPFQVNISENYLSFQMKIGEDYREVHSGVLVRDSKDNVSIMSDWDFKRYYEPVEDVDKKLIATITSLIDKAISEVIVK